MGSKGRPQSFSDGTDPNSQLGDQTTTIVRIAPNAQARADPTAPPFASTLRTEEDIRQFWKGFAIGGGICVFLLILEIVAIVLL
jgi:hypothetical protein